MATNGISATSSMSRMSVGVTADDRDLAQLADAVLVDVQTDVSLCHDDQLLALVRLGVYIAVSV